MVELVLPDLPTNYLSDLSKSLSENGLYSSVSLIFSDCFTAACSKAPSLANFNNLLSSVPGLTHSVLCNVYNKFFGIVAGLFKSLPSAEDFKTVLSALEMLESDQEDCIKAFVEFVDLIKAKRKGWEGALKVPEKVRSQVSEVASEEYLGVRFAEIVDIEWVGGQEICNMHLSRVGETKFALKIYVLTNDCDLGVQCTKEMSQSFHQLRIKAIEFKCNQAELQHLLYQVSEALHEADRFAIPQ